MLRNLQRRNDRIARLLQAQPLRAVHISSKSSDALDIPTKPPLAGSTNEARFEIIGSQFSLLSVKLSALQNLYTRRGTLVGIEGRAENVTSVLSILEPFRRSLYKIPFLYQKISSPTPITALISAKPTNTSMTVVHLDGTEDWRFVGEAVLAWTGRTLSMSPKIATEIVSSTRVLQPVSYWGSSEATGRGLVAVAGKGLLIQVELDAGDSYIAHPSNVVAYSLNDTPPQRYRLNSSSFRFQIPSIAPYLPQSRFISAMRESGTWQTITRYSFNLRTWMRATFLGDRLFVRYQGPRTLILQSRASRIKDVLTSSEVDDIADAQPGVVQPLISADRGSRQADAVDVGKSPKPPPATVKPPQMRTARIDSEGKAVIEP